MTADELVALIAAGKAPAVIDVRSRWEFDRGRVPGAIHIPFWNMGSHIAEVPGAKTDPIVVYCGHGPRAQWAASELRKQGFENVDLLDGHWSAWARAGRPEER